MPMSFASEQVELLQTAYRKVIDGQTVRYGDRWLTMAEATWISAELDKWMRRAAAEAAAHRGGSPGISIADFGGCQ